jgi:hypothetical protein
MSSALTYALIDQTLNVGVEVLFERATEVDSRSDPAYEFLIGPSINVRPTRNTFITVSPQFGVTDNSPDAEVFVIAGFNFSLSGRPPLAKKAFTRPLLCLAAKHREHCRPHHAILVCAWDLSAAPLRFLVGRRFLA